MSFYGSSFSYDNIPSELYGLRISSIDSQAVNESMGSSDVEIMNKKIYRRATPYFYGSTPSPVLSFEMSAYSAQEIDAEFFQLIQKAYFSSRSFKKLQIFQYDMQDVYFNCILKSPKIVRIGNLLTGIKFEVVCDSPFAWRFPKVTNYTYTSSVVNDNVIYNNTTDDTGNYTFPSLIITMNNIGGDLSITNSDDNNRIFSFTGLSPNEILTIDCSLQTISSSTGLKRLSNFNKNFFRLLPKVNHLHIAGSITSIAMTVQTIAKKIAG